MWIRRSSVDGRSYHLAKIVGDAVPAEFAVLDHRLDAFSSQSLAKQPPVVAVVGGKNVQFVYI
jgi:hypothetical protein